MYRGKRCREVVERGQFDELSIAMAARLRQQVVDAIAEGRFDYQKRFPDSTTAKRMLERLGRSAQFPPSTFLKTSVI